MARAFLGTAALQDPALVEAALLQLPDDFRLPVVLRDVLDLEYADIAEQLEVPVGTVKSRVSRARANQERICGVDSRRSCGRCSTIGRRMDVRRGSR